jgi:hypothetical protein
VIAARCINLTMPPSGVGARSNDPAAKPSAIRKSLTSLKLTS